MELGSRSIAGLGQERGATLWFHGTVRPHHGTELRIDGTRHICCALGPTCRMYSGHRMSGDFCRLDPQAEPWPHQIYQLAEQSGKMLFILMA